MENFKYKKSLGQNFMQDENIINKIVNNSDVDKDTLLIEIGPGSGNLSSKIVPLAGFAILYEIDTRLSDILNEKLSDYDNYKIIFGDFLEQDIINDIKGYDYKKLLVVANIPYYITTPIITKLYEEVSPSKMLFLVQEEVANRLSAVPKKKEYGAISVYLNLKYDIHKLFKVSRNCFYPVPNVDSAVISFVKNDKYEIGEYDKIKKFINDCFKYKRKNLKNNLRNYDLERIECILSRYGYSLVNRAEDIPVFVFAELFKGL